MDEDLANAVERYKSKGYRVEVISQNAVVVYNDGVASSYSEFDTVVNSIAKDEGLGFRTQAGMEELHTQTSKNNQPTENFDIYMGVFAGDDPSVLDSAPVPWKN